MTKDNLRKCVNKYAPDFEVLIDRYGIVSFDGNGIYNTGYHYRDFESDYMVKQEVMKANKEGY